MTWEEIKVKYPEYRYNMSEEREREFVNDCFDAYENEKLADTFWSIGGDYPNRIGEAFRIVKRCTEEQCDLCTLPMWEIVFDDGVVMPAYPDEIFEREQIENGRIMKGE